MAGQAPYFKVDPSGDLTLYLEHEDNATKMIIFKSFLVSTKTMCLASPVWKAMCDPEGPWAKQPSDGRGFRLTEDSPEALLTLLNIAHLNFNRVPKKLSFTQLVRISILCDKYDTVRLVRPWISTWISDLRKSRLICDPGNEEWLFVAWVFGEKDIYQKVAKHLVQSVSFDTLGKCLNEQSSPLSENMPPGALDAILDARKRVIEALLQLCQDHVKRYIPAVAENVDTTVSPRCKVIEPALAPRYMERDRAQASQQCDALVVGSLVQGLNPVGLWPVPTNSSSVRMSLSLLKIKLLHVVCHSKSDAGSVYSHVSGAFSSHLKCGFNPNFRVDVQRIFDGVQSGVLEPHHQHLEEQTRKLSLHYS